MQQKSHSTKKHPVSRIELNGKLYDAHTGKLLDTPQKNLQKNVDGFSQPRQNTKSAPVHSRPERSHTLMRHVVKKPSKPSIGRSQAAMDIVGAQITPFRSSALMVEGSRVRSKRAKEIRRNSLVSRFGDYTNIDREMKPDIKKSVISLPVVAPPAQVIKAKPQVTSAADHLINKALKESSTGHAKPHLHKKSRLHHKVAHKIGVSARVASFGLSGLAVMILGAFIAYQNMPNFAVRYASAKAGVNAQLPTYKPSGFAINDRIIYSPGQITVNFKANADDRAFSITQKTSNWSSEALVANYLEEVTKDGPKAQQYTESGRTIFLYGQSNATWVSEGVWYDINGNANLTTDQLIKMAGSI